MQDLLDRLAAGDLPARDALIEQQKDGIAALIGNLALKRPYVDTDEVLQLVLIRIMKAMEVVKPVNETAFYDLVLRHARFVLSDLARDSAEKVGTIKPEDEPATAESADLWQWSAMHIGISKLPTRLREVVSLKIYHGFNLSEIASSLNVSLKTVKRDWKEAVEKLREMVEKDR